MSAPLAGKFQDHYAVLGVDPKADSDTIQQAYSKLAQKYFPNNPETGDPQMFEAINMAYETLSDPQLRAVFDKLKGVGQEDSAIKFSGSAFFEALGREALRRTAVLCVLYDRRITKPSTPSLSMRHLESVVQSTSMELSSSIWYLKQRGLVASDDKSSMQITVDGMDFLESKRPNSAEVLPFIKDSALAEPRIPEQQPKSQPAAKPPQAVQPSKDSLETPLAHERPLAHEEEPVLATLNRALAKI